MAPQELTALVAVMTLLGVAIWGIAARHARIARALGLLVTLLGAFYLYAVWSASASTSVLVSTGLFVGSAVLFRLLSSFEQ